jgi:hypothetical protein
MEEETVATAECGGSREGSEGEMEDLDGGAAVSGVLRGLRKALEEGNRERGPRWTFSASSHSSNNSCYFSDDGTTLSDLCCPTLNSAHSLKPRKVEA